MRLLVIEDEIKTLLAIQQGLVEKDYEVDIARNGLEAMNLFKQNNYDCIITDIVMPYIDGYSIVKTIRELGVDTPILMLTALNKVEDKVKGFEFGIDQYLVKPFTFSELLARVKSLTRKVNKVQKLDTILKFSDLEMNLDKRTVKRGGVLIELRLLEFKLLEYFLRNQGVVLSKTQIAENVWGIKFDRGTNFIEVYINYLRSKINKDFSTKLIHTAFGMGYILKGE